MFRSSKDIDASGYEGNKEIIIGIEKYKIIKELFTNYQYGLKGNDVVFMLMN